MELLEKLVYLINSNSILDDTIKFYGLSIKPLGEVIHVGSYSKLEMLIDNMPPYYDPTLNDYTKYITIFKSRLNEDSAIVESTEEPGYLFLLPISWIQEYGK